MYKDPGNMTSVARDKDPSHPHGDEGRDTSTTRVINSGYQSFEWPNLLKE